MTGCPGCVKFQIYKLIVFPWLVVVTLKVGKRKAFFPSWLGYLQPLLSTLVVSGWVNIEGEAPQASKSYWDEEEGRCASPSGQHPCTAKVVAGTAVGHSPSTSWSCLSSHCHHHNAGARAGWVLWPQGRRIWNTELDFCPGPLFYKSQAPSPGPGSWVTQGIVTPRRRRGGLLWPRTLPVSLDAAFLHLQSDPSMCRLFSALYPKCRHYFQWCLLFGETRLSISQCLFLKTYILEQQIKDSHGLDVVGLGKIRL